MASDTESGSEYEVVKILQQRRRRGLTEFLVRWSGFGPQEDSWEQEGKLKNCGKLIQDFVKSSLTPAKKTTKRASRSRSSSRSRSRSRSRGRASSKSRKSPSRKKVATPVTEKPVSIRQSRRLTAGADVVKETTTTTTRTVEELKPLNSVDEDVKRTVVKETWTTKTTQAKSTDDRKPAWQPQLPEFLRLNTSDVPVMIIFSCITIITLCFLLERYVDFEAVWNSLAAGCEAVIAQVESLRSGSEKVAAGKQK
ncbi:testis-specific chromodomain protein Y 2-like [Mizuhopecten yessoensis]|uniref:Testis-specific chromodomain protein Y 2 n=1 Tax=Mizuhopecten yessoensis TaxID=6573 RepID=A0A210QF44_MIZYE|nr:testis-specific chromodomain protein Y 2-like [Mizuhopecten yessoensis]OWF47355.1 Testis-specific chromodomain protein Y 2 [Mizuhopecten yessoensis]